ncbi:MAG: helix-turn-helix domain-containing protein [Hydrogeniiclostridium mannosilyticum]
MHEIGNRIRLLRKAENLTQKDFSKRLLISQSYLSGLKMAMRFRQANC